MAWGSSDLVPDGVNLGGWFVLEDWFYSAPTGPHRGHHVNTDEPAFDKASSKLRTEAFVADVHRILNLTQEERGRLARSRFGCETDLVNLLLQSGLSEERVVQLFWEHRRTYITPVDFARIRALGIRRVRLPLTWCLTYDTPYAIRGRDFVGRETQVDVRPGARVVEDPFTNDPAFDPEGMASPSDKWVSIPIRVVEAVLETAAACGVEVLLDLHAFPGGAAAGTFNGVWPVNPRFWSADHDHNMRVIMTRLLDWMVSLETSNPLAFKGLYGFTPMNEPAHMRGLVELLGCSPYDLRGNRTWAAGISTADVLNTLAIGVEEFRKRPTLTSSKVLVMNIIETVFATLFGAGDEKVFGASQKAGIERIREEIAHWWKRTTTEAERRTWAVLDIHNYIAWDGRVEKFRDIKSETEFSNLIEEMSSPFFEEVRKHLDMPAPQRLDCSEYSASCDRDTLLSITSGVGTRPSKFPGFSWMRLRDSFLASQHRVAKRNSIIMWFWTYHIRRNVNFQGEWSLQHILSPWPRCCNFLAEGLWVQAAKELALSVIHGFSWAALLLRASARSPLRALWGQRLGARFDFYGGRLV